MRILVAGDYCPRDRVVRKIRSGDTADMLASVKETIAAVDYALVNFECAVVDVDAKPIKKCGPNLKCQPEAVKVLKDAGFHCLTLANNHFRDYGDVGVLSSLRYFKENGLDYVGGGENIVAAEAVLYKKFGDEVLAIVNVCETEFSIASPQRAGSAPLDVVKVYHRIVDAHKQSDYVLVIIHGGHEHFQLPSPRMKELYRFFIEVGADAVVNHHQHCYSGYEEFMGKPIIYGLGNFLFDHPKKRGCIWNEGYLAMIEFSTKRVSFTPVPYIQCDEKAIVKLLRGERLQIFEQLFASINDAITDDRLFEDKWNEYVRKRSQTIITPFTPYNNEYVRAAVGRHWIPYCIPRKKMAEMLNYIICEAHRDLLTIAMQDKLEDK